jgi:lambda family phage portal protein
MDRNDALVGTLADRRVDNVVQGGFTLDPKTGDKELDLELWQWWEDTTDDPDQCDIAGEMTWREIERQVCRSESIDGDIVVTGTQDGPFQLIESHLIRTKSREADTFLGVTSDKYGKRLAYHVAEELDEFGTFGDVEPIQVRNRDGLRQVFHVYDPKRVNSTRGVTQLAPIFSLSGMLEDINFAKLVQQQVVSCFAIFRKMAATGSPLPSTDPMYGEGSTERTASGTRQIEGVSPGMEITGQPGEELEGFSPNVPNSEYFQQVRLMLQIIGVNFGLPLCLVLMDGSETNFSGWRGAVDEARKGFIADQLNLVRRLHRPAYKWRLAQHLKDTKDTALKRAAGKLGDKIFRHNWNLPTWSYIEPVADAKGDAEQLRNSLTSPRRLHAARGKDWEEVAEESVEDNAYAIERAAEKAEQMNDAFPGSKFDWRDFISLPMPQGVTVSKQDSAESDPVAGPAAPAVSGDEKKNDEQPVAKSEYEPTAAGGWRTTKDGSRVFIGDDGSVRVGGPGGPTIGQKERLRDRIEGTQKEANREVTKAKKSVEKIKSRIAEVEAKKAANNKAIEAMRDRLGELDAKRDAIAAKLAAIRARKAARASAATEKEDEQIAEADSLLKEAKEINGQLESLEKEIEATNAA